MTTKVNSTHSSEQFSTFFIANRMYGIPVRKVQEIVKPMDLTSVPLAPAYVRGLINLRGQVTTAIGLRELFDISDEAPEHLMNVVCRHTGSLVSFQVDEIGDVVQVSQDDFEATPQTIPDQIRQFMHGVYKLNGQLLSIIDVDLIIQHLNETNSKDKDAS